MDCVEFDVKFTKPQDYSEFVSHLSRKGWGYQPHLWLCRFDWGSAFQAVDMSGAGLVGSYVWASYEDRKGGKKKPSTSYKLTGFLQYFKNLLSQGKPFRLHIKEVDYGTAELRVFIEEEQQRDPWEIEINRHMDDAYRSLFETVFNGPTIKERRFDFKMPCCTRNSRLFIELNPGDPVRYTAIPSEQVDTILPIPMDRSKFKTGIIPCDFWPAFDTDEVRRCVFDGHLLWFFGAKRGTKVEVIKLPGYIRDTYMGVLRCETKSGIDVRAIVINRKTDNNLFSKIFYSEEESNEEYNVAL